MSTLQPYSLQDSDLLLDIDMLSDAEQPYVLKIRDLPDEDKPREKLMELGARALSVQELLSVVLSSGTKKEGVLEMSSRIIKEYGEQVFSQQKNAQEIALELDIPELKAMQIVACAELGRRFFQKDVSPMATLRTAQDVYEYLSDMRTLQKEHMRGIYLNTHYKVIRDEIISIGTVNSNLIHPREVFKPAIEYGAVGIILAHNHPSNIVEPSAADIAITKQLVEAGKIIGIHVIDHIIVGTTGFKSIKVEY